MQMQVKVMRKAAAGWKWLEQSRIEIEVSEPLLS